MKALTRVLGAGLFALVAGWLLLGARGGEGADAKKAILKIADAFEKGDKATATSEAKALAKKIEEVGEVMDLLKPRKKKGIGVGKTAGKVMPDGIEQMIIALGRDTRSPDKLANEGPALERMSYVTAAVMEVALHKAPEKDEGTKTRALWTKSATEARDGALELAKAARAKDSPGVKTAASHTNAACNNCHGEFR